MKDEKPQNEKRVRNNRQVDNFSGLSASSPIWERSRRGENPVPNDGNSFQNGLNHVAGPEDPTHAGLNVHIQDKLGFGEG